jgi:hypothetical protein
MKRKIIPMPIAEVEVLVQQQYSFKGVAGVKPPLGGEALNPPMLQNL